MMSLSLSKGHYVKAVAGSCGGAQVIWQPLQQTVGTLWLFSEWEAGARLTS